VDIESLINFRLFNTGRNKYITLGVDGWLYYNPPGDGYNVTDYVRNNLFSAEEVEQIRRNIASIRENFYKRKIPIIIVTAPNKNTIYPEYLPFRLSFRRNGPSRVDQIESIAREEHVEFVNFRDTILSSKKKYTCHLYDMTDTHWNDIGAYIGYTQLHAALRKHVNISDKLDIKKYNIVYTTTTGKGDLAAITGLSGCLRDELVELKPKTPLGARRIPNSDPNDRVHDIFENHEAGNIKAVIIRDSFTTSMIPFISEHFKRSVYLRQQYIDMSVVDREKPDIVVYEFVERYSSNFLMPDLVR